MKHPVLFGLCLSYIFLNTLDAIITVLAIENGLGAEINGTMGFIIQKTSLYHAMILKLILITATVSFFYFGSDKFDSIQLGRFSIKGITIIHFGLVLINLFSFLVVLNGLIVIFFPTFAPFKI